MTMFKNIFVENAWEVMTKGLVARAAYLGLVGPDLFNLLIQAMDQGWLVLQPETKNYLRVVALALIILLRPVNQGLAKPPGGSQ